MFVSRKCAKNTKMESFLWINHAGDDDPML